MSKHVLTIASDYRSEWGVGKAVMELFQNALDAEKEIPDNKMFFSYDSATQKLLIGNKSSILLRETLLLGVSSKKDDEQTVGRFGEGYKLGTVILLNRGKRVTFYNYGAREVWATRLITSRVYGGRKVPEFNVQKVPAWNKVPDNALTIEVDGITEAEYAEVKKSILQLQDIPDDEVIESRDGRVLLNKEFSGKFFVNGLYVCTDAEFQYGYDMSPSILKLDSSRNLVDTWQLAYRTAEFWAAAKQEQDVSRCLEMINATNPPKDVKQMSKYDFYGKNPVTSGALERFHKTYGTDAVPVTTQEMAEKVRNANKVPVVVNECLANTLNSVLSAESIYTDYVKENISSKSIVESLSLWFGSVKNKLSEEDKDDFKGILARVKAIANLHPDIFDAELKASVTDSTADSTED